MALLRHGWVLLMAAGPAVAANQDHADKLAMLAWLDPKLALEYSNMIDSKPGEPAAPAAMGTTVSCTPAAVAGGFGRNPRLFEG